MDVGIETPGLCRLPQGTTGGANRPSRERPENLSESCLEDEPEAVWRIDSHERTCIRS